MSLYSCLISGTRILFVTQEKNKRESFALWLGKTFFKILIALVINLVNCIIASGLLFLTCVCAFVVCQCWSSVFKWNICSCLAMSSTHPRFKDNPFHAVWIHSDLLLNVLLRCYMGLDRTAPQQLVYGVKKEERRFKYLSLNIGIETSEYIVSSTWECNYSSDLFRTSTCKPWSEYLWPVNTLDLVIHSLLALTALNVRSLLNV